MTIVYNVYDRAGTEIYSSSVKTVVADNVEYYIKHNDYPAPYVPYLGGIEDSFAILYKLPTIDTGWNDTWGIRFSLGSRVFQGSPIKGINTLNTLNPGYTGSHVVFQSYIDKRDSEHYSVHSYKGINNRTEYADTIDKQIAVRLLEISEIDLNLITNKYGISIYDENSNVVFDSRLNNINLNNVVSLKYRETITLNPGEYIIPLYSRALGGLLSNARLERVNRGQNLFVVDDWLAGIHPTDNEPSLIFIRVPELAEKPNTIKLPEDKLISNSLYTEVWL